MYAIVEAGGKQHKVVVGQVLRCESLKGDVGDTITLDKVLMLADADKISMGSPYLAKASVEAKIATHGRGEKIQIIKFRRRKHYMRRQGHRQSFTELSITQISGSASD